jgi:hypothetical protein
MSYNDDIERIKNKEVVKGLPHDLEVAVQTFIEQAIILDDNDLDFMPHEYIVNLLTTLAKYPEHRPLLFDLLRVMGIPMDYGVS